MTFVPCWAKKSSFKYSKNDSAELGAAARFEFGIVSDIKLSKKFCVVKKYRKFTG
jgi:hypothetical protein